MNGVIASPDHLLYSIEKHFLDTINLNYMKFVLTKQLMISDNDKLHPIASITMARKPL